MANPNEKLFSEESPAGGCASGECLPADDEVSEPAATPLSRSTTWRDAVDAVRVVSSRHGASLAFGRVLSAKSGEIRLAYSAQGGFHRTTVSGSGKAIIEKALTDFYRQRTVVIVEERTEEFTAAAPSLAETDARGKADRERSAESKIRTHPAVKAALKLLGGEIEHIQVLEEEQPAVAASPTPPVED
ncbi:MAG: DNA polymerase III subunit gamma/tau [Myxococcaceae bacterium]